MKHVKMATTTIVIFLLLWSGAGKAQPLTEWTLVDGTANYNSAWSVDAIKVDPVQDGKFYVVGDDYGSQCDIRLIKLDSNGNVLWNRTYGDAGFERPGGGVVATEDGGAFIGATRRPLGEDYTKFYLIRVDSYGDVQWEKTFTYGLDGNNAVYGMTATSDGGVVLSGFSSAGLVDEDDGYVVRVDSEGNEIWSNTYDEGVGLDEVLIGLQQTKDGGFVISGVANVDYSAYEYDGADLYVLKVNSEGTKEWSALFGGEYWDSGGDVVELPSGEFVVAGDSCSLPNYGECDLYMVKLSATGSLLWQSTYGEVIYSGANSIIRNPNGYLLAAGSRTDPITGIEDMLLLKTDENGVEQWSEVYGGSSTERASGLVLTHEAGYIIVGNTYSYGAGGSDIYVVKTESDAFEVVKIHSVYTTDASGFVQDTFYPDDTIVYHVNFSLATEAAPVDVNIIWKVSGMRHDSDDDWTYRLTQIKTLPSGDHHLTWESTVSDRAKTPSEPDVRVRVRVPSEGLKDRKVYEFNVVAAP